MSNNKTRMLVEGGIMIALSLVLGSIKIFSMKQGGSITLGQMIPLLVYALRWGFWPGIIAGVVMGCISPTLDGFENVIHPIQFLLDYPLAFGAMGIAGLFRKNYLIDKNFIYATSGIVLAIFTRFIMHVLSGAIFFKEYASPGQNAWIYSIIYNGSYLAIECIVAILIFIYLAPRISKVEI